MTPSAMKIGRVEYALLVGAGFLPFAELRPLPPIPGFWGQWLAVMLFMGWLAWRSARRCGETGDRRWPWASLALLALAALTALQAAGGHVLYRTAALVAVFELVLAALVCAEAWRATDRGERTAVLEAFSVGTVLAVTANALGILMAHLGWELSWVHIAAHALPNGREIGLISQANHLGTLAVLGWLAAGYLHARGRLPLAAYLALSAVSGALVASSISRTAIVLSVALTVLQLAYLPRAAPGGASGPLTTRRWALAFLLFAGLQVLVPQLNERRDRGDVPQLSVVRQDVPGRLEMLHDAAELGLRQPLAGVGFGRFSTARLFELDGSLAEHHAGHPHNLLAQAWAEWGAPGLMVVAAALAAVLVAMWRAWRRPPGGADEAQGLLLASGWIAALLLHSLVEYPLWSTYFLLPFALMLGLLPHGGVTAGTLVPTPRAGVLGLAAAGLLVGLLAAADYLRSERLATQVLAQMRASAEGRARIDRARAMQIANLTLFPESAELMHLRVLDVDPMLPDLKLEVATRALGALPHPETAARYVAFRLMLGEAAQAKAFVEQLRRRFAPLAEETEVHLRVLAAQSPALHAFLRDHMPAVLAEAGGPTAAAVPR